MSELRLNTDGHIIKFGADNDVSLTHVADTGLLLNSTMQLQFNDASQNINAPSATVLDINATDEIELNATAVDLNGTLDVSGTLTQTGVATFSARSVHSSGITIADAGQIGSASDADSIAIASNGVVTFTQAPVFPDGSIAVADLDIDGATDIGAAIVDADLFIVDDGAGGTNRKTTAARLKTYIGSFDADAAQVFNESGADVDFRIESNGNANMFVINGGGDRVGVGADPDLGVGLHVKSADSGASVDAGADEIVVEGSANSGISILSGTSGEGSVNFGDSGDNNIGMLQYHHSNNSMQIYTAGSEQLRIKQGNDNHFYTFDSTQTQEDRYTMYIMSDKAEGNSANRMIGFDNSGQGRGYIVAGDGDSDAPSFAAGSDRRLKENITNYTGGYDKIKSIPVKQWDEKYSSKKKGKIGWIADELDDVFPNAVSGTPNATKEVKNSILDKDGRCVIESVNKEFLDKKQANGKWSDCTFHETATVPNYQYSSPLKFFPDVVQALQKAITKIESLEARVTTLEG